jgi:hypothetical protein
VTVEAAIAMGALVAVVCLVFAGVVAVIDHLRCVDAAREAARLMARGDEGLAHEAAGRIAPRGARLAISVSGEKVQVQVTADLLPGLTLSGTAYAVAEPGEAG